MRGGVGGGLINEVGGRFNAEPFAPWARRHVEQCAEGDNRDNINDARGGCVMSKCFMCGPRRRRRFRVMLDNNVHWQYLNKCWQKGGNQVKSSFFSGFAVLRSRKLLRIVLLTLTLW